MDACEQNVPTGYLSRVINSDDWMANVDIFRMLDRMRGPRIADRFANVDNTQAEHLNNPFFFSLSQAVDTFIVYWHSDSNWLVCQLHLSPGC